MGKLPFCLERAPIEQLGWDCGIQNKVSVEQPEITIKLGVWRIVDGHLLDLLDSLVSPRHPLGDTTISDVDVLFWISETSGERLGNGECGCLGIPSQKRHIAGVLAIIWGIILVVIVVAGRWSEGGGLGWQIMRIWTVGVVGGIWCVGRERWGWGCCDVRSGRLFQLKSGRLTHAGANKTTWDALPVL